MFGLVLPESLDQNMLELNSRTHISNVENMIQVPRIKKIYIPFFSRPLNDAQALLTV